MKTSVLTLEQISKLVELAKMHNDNVDRFINVTLKEHFGTDCLNMSQWFEARELISQQEFYKKGKAILDTLRAFGIHCMMDMQNNKLVCPDYNIFAR